MRAGTLRQRITIQQKTVTRDAYGAEVITWADVVTDEPAAVLPIRGREYVALKQAQADVTTRFVIRYRSGITPAMRILHGSAVYDITDVINPKEGDRTLELMASAPAVAS